MQTKLPHPLVSLIPLIAAVGLISLTLVLFPDDALGGGSQVSLLLASSVCVAISLGFYHGKWKEFENAIKNTIGDTASSLVVLFMIGMLSGVWMISGVVPTFIYYGIQIMSPKFFLLSACVISGLVSVMTGSSWTTIATIGIALLGIGNALGIPEAMTAGAIISGAYFGDKMSPLSDTTVLAASVAGTDLFCHIRHMMITTVPSLLITLVIFLFLGFSYDGLPINVAEYTEGLNRTFNISLWTLVVPLFTIVLIYFKVPSIMTLILSAMAAAACALIAQPHILSIIGGEDYSGWLQQVRGLVVTFATSTNIETGSAKVNDLVSTGGMAGMLNTVWLILCAMCFGSCMMASRMLESITRVVLKLIRGTFSMVTSMVVTGILMNIIMGDQYLSIILNASMYKDVFKKRGYMPELLSRTAEDSATVTSVLIPWNSCGMTQSTVLGVPTLVYLPFCFYNILTPIMSCIVAAIGWKIKKVAPTEDNEKQSA